MQDVNRIKVLDPVMQDVTDSGWLAAFHKVFLEEMRSRLISKTNAALGLMRIYLNVGEWGAHEIIRRQRYKARIYDETGIEVLGDPEFKKRVASNYSYNLTGNGMEIEIFKIEHNGEANPH